MGDTRIPILAKVALGTAALALLVAAGLSVASFIAGVDTETGAQLSQTGASLTVPLVVIVVVLSGWLDRRRRLGS